MPGSKLSDMLRIFCCFVLPLLLASTCPAGAAEIYVGVNQVGYRSHASKVAIVMSREPLPKSFQLIDAESGKSAFEGNLRPVNGSWAKFSHVAAADFSK